MPTSIFIIVETHYIMQDSDKRKKLHLSCFRIGRFRLKKRHNGSSKPKSRLALSFIIITLLAVSVGGGIVFRDQLIHSSDSSPTTPTTPNTSPSPSPSPTPTPTFQPKVLNKSIPPDYVMGLPVDGGLVNGMNVVFIQNSNQKISIRFTAQQSGTITSLVVYAFAYKQGKPTIRVGLQEDQQGNPKGQWINEAAFGTIQLPSSSGFKTVQLQQNTTISKGQIYHVVMDSPSDQLNGTVAVNTYQANSLTQPLNPDDPDIPWTDNSINVLAYDGQGWHAQNKWPIFVVKYSDGTMQGQPYSIAAPWVVYGSTFVGQTIIPASEYKVGRIAFDVSLKSGTPQGNLNYQIRDSNNTVLAEGIFAEPGQLTTSQKWIEVTLTTPVTLKAGTLYRVIVLSPSSNLENGYYLYGHEFSYNNTIGYGGLQHKLTSSLDSGAHWGDNLDADAIFKLTTTA